MPNVKPISAFNDNYIWCIEQAQHCVVVDPGSAKEVEAHLKQQEYTLDAILVTHHHFDHTGGVHALKKKWSCPVYGPAHSEFSDIDHPLNDGDSIKFDTLETELTVWATPAHTLDHIVYWNNHWLFCGDTLFAAGCGRVFEGEPIQMHQALNRLAQLDPSTQVFCAHEYTQKNLEFAHWLEPNNAVVNQRYKQVQSLREQDQVSLPSTIELEQQTNPFLRCAEKSVQEAVSKRAKQSVTDPLATFTLMRALKDQF